MNLELEPILFHYQFLDCPKDHNVKYFKINESDYLVIRIFSKGQIADLLYESYGLNQSPCTSRLLEDKVIKQGFTSRDGNLIDQVIAGEKL